MRHRSAAVHAIAATGCPLDSLPRASPMIPAPEQRQARRNGCGKQPREVRAVPSVIRLRRAIERTEVRVRNQREWRAISLNDGELGVDLILVAVCPGLDLSQEWSQLQTFLRNDGRDGNRVTRVFGGRLTAASLGRASQLAPEWGCGSVRKSGDKSLPPLRFDGQRFLPLGAAGTPGRSRPKPGNFGWPLLLFTCARWVVAELGAFDLRRALHKPGES